MEIIWRECLDEDSDLFYETRMVKYESLIYLHVVPEKTKTGDYGLFGLLINGTRINIINSDWTHCCDVLSEIRQANYDRKARYYIDK